jgi:hypothetical protein
MHNPAGRHTRQSPKGVKSDFMKPGSPLEWFVFSYFPQILFTNIYGRTDMQ